MDNRFDVMSKLLAEGIPRREALRRFGGLFGGALLAVGWGSRTKAGTSSDSLCAQFCQGADDPEECLELCQECGGPRFFCTPNSESCCRTGNCCDGTCCGTLPEAQTVPPAVCCHHKCCFFPHTCCQNVYGGICTNLKTDPRNCGTCGNLCFSITGAAVVCCNGNCCDVGELCCDNSCTDVSSDSDNCGKCGNVCPTASPNCVNGTCVTN